MSFWSSLLYVRSAPAPAVAVVDISRFLHGVAASGASVGDSALLCQIKYGDSVDADERTTDVIEWDESGIIGTVGDYPWDRSETFASISTMADALATDTSSVYRAFLQLGQAHASIVSAMTRAPSDENQLGLCLWDLSFRIGPVSIAGSGNAEPAFAGWMALVLSGPGYFYPWTFREVRERAETNELIGGLAATCRAAWPVEPTKPTPSAVAGRRQCGELWLYDDLEHPHDWLWFASESG